MKPNKLTLLLILTLIIPITHAALNDSNVLYLTFNQNYTIYNIAWDSLNQHNGTLTSTGNNDTDAVLNTSANFTSPNSYVFMGDLSYTNQTFSFWIDWDNMGSAEWILSKWAAGVPRWGLHLDAANNMDYYHDAAGWTIVTPMVNSTYHHVVMFQNTTVTKIWFDSRSVFNHTGTVSQAGNDLIIGGYDDGSNNGGFTGNIDEFVMWNRSLTFTEIKDLWNNGDGYNFYDQQINTSINVLSSLNGAPITEYNITINGTTTNLQNNTFVTGIDRNEPNNITVNISKTGFTTYHGSYIPLNQAVPYSINLTPHSPQVNNITIINQPNLTGQILQYQINYNATPFIYILQSNITNPYDNTLNLTTNWTQYTNSMNFNYTLRRQDFADNITATISICTTWACYNYSALNYTINQIDHNIQFIPRSNLSNTTLTNINLNFLDKGIITNSTPYTTTLSTFLNYSMRHNVTQINVTHLPEQYVNNLYNYNITENMTSIYLYLQPNPFTLNFFLGDAAYNVYGTCMHGNGSVSWFNESIVTYQQNFSQGKVECQFSKFNHSEPQAYYEFYNNLTTVSDNITLVNYTHYKFYVQAVGLSTVPIDDVQVRYFFTYAETNNWTLWDLGGQRLTDDSGITHFLLDYNAYGKLELTKYGKTPEEYLIHPFTVSFNSYDNPYKIQMKDSVSWRQNKYIYTLKNTILNKTKDTYGTIYLQNYNTFSYTTSYRNQTSVLPPYNPQLSFYGRYPIILESGVDYSPSTSDDIIVQFYIDDITFNHTIHYQYVNHTHMFTNVTANAPANVLNIALLMLILILSIFIGYIFSTAHASLHAFFIGLMIVSFISATYIIPAVLALLYYLFKILYKVVSE